MWSFWSFITDMLISNFWIQFRFLSKKMSIDCSRQAPIFWIETYKRLLYYRSDVRDLVSKSILISILSQHPRIILEKFVNERPENMTSIPSNSIDFVVSSSIHCSVDNSQSVLKEIRRVLVPVSNNSLKFRSKKKKSNGKGGRNYFFEHVIDEPHTMRYKWQMFVNKGRLWQMTWHGCVLADFEPKISKFELFKYKGKRYTMAVV